MNETSETSEHAAAVDRDDVVGSTRRCTALGGASNNQPDKEEGHEMTTIRESVPWGNDNEARDAMTSYTERFVALVSKLLELTEYDGFVFARSEVWAEAQVYATFAHPGLRLELFAGLEDEHGRREATRVYVSRRPARGIFLSGRSIRTKIHSRCCANSTGGTPAAPARTEGQYYRGRHQARAAPRRARARAETVRARNAGGRRRRGRRSGALPAAPRSRRFRLELRRVRRRAGARSQRSPRRPLPPDVRRVPAAGAAPVRTGLALAREHGGAARRGEGWEPQRRGMW